MMFNRLSSNSLKKTFFALIAGSFLSISSAVEPSERSVIQLLDVMGVAKSHEDSIKEFFLPLLIKNMPKGSEAFTQQALQQAFDEKSYSKTLIPSYQKTFTQADIDASLAFFQTDAGQKFLQAQTELSAEASVNSELWFVEVTERIYKQYLKADPN